MSLNHRGTLTNGVLKAGNAVTKEHEVMDSHWPVLLLLWVLDGANTAGIVHDIY